MQKVCFFLISEPAAAGALSHDEYAGPNVSLMFNRSVGHVDQYNVSILSQMHTVNPTVAGNFQTVTFSDLTPGALYNVSIVAVIITSQGDILSDPVVHEFRVKANSK